MYPYAVLSVVMNSHQIETSAHGRASYVKQRPTAEGCSYLYAAGGLRHSCINNEPNLLNLLKLSLTGVFQKNRSGKSSTGNLKKKKPAIHRYRERARSLLFIHLALMGSLLSHVDTLLLHSTWQSCNFQVEGCGRY